MLRHIVFRESADKVCSRVLPDTPARVFARSKKLNNITDSKF
jgi:hypothetical protein